MTWEILNNMGKLQVKHGSLSTLNEYSGLDGELLWADDVGRLYITDVLGQKILIGGNGAFASTFLALSDTPSSYVNHAGKLVRVNTKQNGLEFYALPDYDNYHYWQIQVDATEPIPILSERILRILSGNGISVINQEESAISINIIPIPANSIVANKSASPQVPTGMAIDPQSVPGRLLTGDLVNIRIGTGANQIAWGDHTHAQLHNQSHALVSSDHTASGLTIGKFIVATGATTFAWSALRMPQTCQQGDILYASATDQFSKLVKSTTPGHFISNTGTLNNPAWKSIDVSDLPAKITKYYAASYENAGVGILTLTITAAVHGCGLIPLVQFFEKNGTIDYRLSSAEIIINQSTGDITVNTSVAVVGKVIIAGGS